MKIEVINYSQGPVNIVPDLWKNRKLEGSPVSIKSNLRCSQKSDFIGFQMDLKVDQEDETAFSMGFLIGMKVEGWSDILQISSDPEEIRKHIKDICEYFWTLATGVVAVTSSADHSRSLILPPLDIEKFIKDVIITVNSSISKE